jgi:hypothetical protein
MILTLPSHLILDLSCSLPSLLPTTIANISHFHHACYMSDSSFKIVLTILSQAYVTMLLICLKRIDCTYTGFGVLTTTKMPMLDFEVVTPCGHVGEYERVGGT